MRVTFRTHQENAITSYCAFILLVGYIPVVTARYLKRLARRHMGGFSGRGQGRAAAPRALALPPPAAPPPVFFPCTQVPLASA